MADSTGMDVSALARAGNPPLLAEHPRTWELLGVRDIYEIDDSRDQLFRDAMAENTSWHLERNDAYRRYCKTRGFTLNEAPTSVGCIPAMWADLFKENNLATLRDGKLMQVSSSGTSGRPTKIWIDVETVMRMWAMGQAAFGCEGLISTSPANYLIVAPDPKSAAGLGNAHFFSSLVEFAPAAEVVYALRRGTGETLELDARATMAALSRFSSAELPARIIGLPALMAELAAATPRDAVRLPDDSLVLTGGGWKARHGAALQKEEFRTLLRRAWGVPPARVRDLYGMTEHAVHYLECPNHRFHVPVHARVRVVDPLDLSEVPQGEAGVIHLMNPGFTTMPFHSLVTADVGRVVGECSCGRGTPAFEVLGRGGVLRHRGCAVLMLERLAR